MLPKFHFLLSQIKRLKSLEREQDSLWTGLQVLERARLWYRHRLENNRSRQANVGTGAGARAEVWGGEVSYYSEIVLHG